MGLRSVTAKDLQNLLWVEPAFDVPSNPSLTRSMVSLIGV